MQIKPQKLEYKSLIMLFFVSMSDWWCKRNSNSSWSYGNLMITSDIHQFIINHILKAYSVQMQLIISLNELIFENTGKQVQTQIHFKNKGLVSVN